MVYFFKNVDKLDVTNDYIFVNTLKQPAYMTLDNTRLRSDI